MTGEQVIHGSQSDVWNELNDPETLKMCLPGCEVIDRIADNEFRIEMMAVVGPVKARFKGTLTISELDPPNGYVLSFDGSGGAAGFAKGRAAVALSPEADMTRLAYRATAQIGGKLAQVGSRLVDGVARKMVEEFFTRFNDCIAAKSAAATPKDATIVDATPMEQPSEATRPRVRLAIAAVALLIVAIWIIYLLLK